VLENLKTTKNLEALTQGMSSLLPTIMASVDTISNDLESKLEEVKSFETQIRDYLNKATNHLREA
jgi:hypothetical protein